MQNTTAPYILCIGRVIMASVEGFSKVERDKTYDRYKES